MDSDLPNLYRSGEPVTLAPVGSLVDEAPPTCDADTPIAEAVHMMTGWRALIVDVGEEWGIITDADIRARVVAAGIPTTLPVSTVMSYPARTVEASASAEEALLMMLENDIHHLLVMEGGRLVGLVSDLDILSLQRRRPFLVRSRIRSATSREDLLTTGRDLPATALGLWRGGVDAEHIGHAQSVIVDAMIARLIDLRMEESGPAPTAWAWLALGSLGRRERAIVGDQDHALVYEDVGSGNESYFSDLAEYVVAGLEEAGIPRCASNVMASDPAFRQPMDVWIERLRSWMAEGETGAFFGEIVLDYRKAAGSLDHLVPALDEVARSARQQQRFLLRLARLATHQHPPIGFFGNIEVEDAGGGTEVFDIKATALHPITELARLFALEIGITVPGTYERLRRVAVSGSQWAESAGSLDEAHRVLQNVRLQHQAGQLSRGLPVDNLVDPSEFGSVVQRSLKEAFRVVRRVQSRLQNWIELTA